MELRKVIEDRRSIRMFLEKKVSSDILEQGILYATMAPSAHNRQPWKFMILSEEEKNHISDLLYNKTKDIVGHSGVHTSKVMKEAPHLIMVFYDGDSVDRDMDIISLGAAIQNMILYFTDCHLGTLWIGNTNLVNEEIQKYLNVSYESISCVALGYANQSPHSRPRKEMDEVIIKRPL